VRPPWNTFTVPVGISDELANLIWLLVGVAVGVAVGDGLAAEALGLADGDAEALGLADGDAEALGLADGDDFGLALFTGTGTPLPQTNLPLFLMQVNF
jgi:hypothetical protein